MASCFVIMPVTTPKNCVNLYSDDAHFEHVLDHLFIPAIKLAGFEPILPIAKGSELIHAEIIKKLESSDLVLCDMTLLNPNVFFELGIRTALNKPVCMVKDEKTEHVPFDAKIINHHTYNSTLAAWKLEDQIKKMNDHIQASMISNSKNNPLWSCFGMSVKAEHLDEEIKKEIVDRVMAEVKSQMTPTYKSKQIRFEIDANMVSKDKILSLTTLIKKFPGKCEGYMHIRNKKSETVIYLGDQLRLDISDKLIKEADSILGKGATIPY